MQTHKMKQDNIIVIEEDNSIFKRPVWVAAFALTAAVVWGLAYPLIKLGFSEFHITPSMTGSKMLFAGLRFFFCGVIILSVAKATHRKFAVEKSSDWLFVLLFSLLNTTFHYAFFYFGLSHSEGARAAILNSMSVFTVVILACIFFKSDRMTSRKFFGVVIGIAGILALNLGGKDSGHFTWLGDGMIILNALCSAVASLMTRSLCCRVDVFVGTGYSLGLGGALLVVPGLLMGGMLPVVTLYGIFILLMLIAISIIGFTLYNRLLLSNPIGKIAIYNSLIPVVGAVTSCLFLGETFYSKYIVAATLATVGIYIINSQKK